MVWGFITVSYLATRFTRKQPFVRLQQNKQAPGSVDHETEEAGGLHAGRFTLPSRPSLGTARPRALSPEPHRPGPARPGPAEAPGCSPGSPAAARPKRAPPAASPTIASRRHRPVASHGLARMRAPLAQSAALQRRQGRATRVRAP